MSYVLCTQCCQCLWIVRSGLPPRFSLTFIHYLECVLCLVYPVLSVSLDCPFWIAASVFYDVYLLPRVCRVSCVPSVASVSGLPPRFSMTFIYYLECVLCLGYPVLPVSLDCPFWIAASVFSNVYSLPRVCPMSCVPSVVSVSGLPPRFSLTFIHYLECVLCLVYPVLSVSLDCPFWIAASVFYDVYLLPTVLCAQCL